MYIESKQRYQKEMSITKLIKSVSLMRTMLKNSFLTKEMKFNCIHSNKGTIYLDNSDDDDNSNSVEEQGMEQSD